MMTEMYNDAISKCTPPLPSCDPPPPPTITITMSRCLKYENFLWNKYPNEAEWMLKLKACSLLNGKCENRKIVCIDYSQNPARVVTLLDECEIIQEPDCSYDEPITPPQGKTWEEAWETNCFARPCCP
ncbi:MAG: hypothetical protein N2319_08900 [Candidatus Kapabacteria bacterium]|nr:hypothetical protein [Candidatus Kapabacteria bacterium]